ncbi:MAG: histidine triad nucleotide-binding protein [Candidatus Omnitrophica bacterium]|nr:histidine triad nucleotide-binding protein [Candidatus Omnitrophota bacterium]
MNNNCVFCKIIKQEIPADIVYEDDDVLAFLDIRAQAPVHILLVPKVHIEKVSDLNENVSYIVSKLVLAANKIARDKGLNEDGYRLVFNCGENAGQEVLHLHLHLLGGRKFTWPPG